MIGTYLLLTLLSCGLFALDAGPWQDDTSALARARIAEDEPFGGFFASGPTPTRRFKSIVYASAIRSPDPFAVLIVTAVLIWCAQGFVSHYLGRELFKGSQVAACLAGGLTLCATSDYLTASAVGLGYQMSVLAFAAALLLLLRWCREGRRVPLFASAALLGIGLFTADGLVSSLVLAPVLVFAATPPESRRRAGVGVILWGLVSVPYLIAFAIELNRAAGYARRAIRPLTWTQWLSRSGDLFAYNFMPWRWLDRPPAFSGAPPPSFVPDSVYWAVACLGAAALVMLLLAATARDSRVGEIVSGSRHRSLWRVSGSLLMMTLAVNAMYAWAQLAELYYRTHLVSRVWASLLVAGILTWAIRSVRSRPAALTAVGLLAGLGLWSGMERQDYYLSSWRTHRVELASIVEAAPALTASSRLILYGSAPGYQATEAHYLAQSWAVLLYADPTMYRRTILWSPSRRAGCSLAEDGLLCWGEGQEECVASGGCQGVRVPYADAVVMQFVPASGRYVLVRDLNAILPDDLPSSAAAYAPLRHIGPGPIPELRTGLLTESRLLGRWLGRPVDQAPRRRP